MARATGSETKEVLLSPIYMHDVGRVENEGVGGVATYDGERLG